MPVSLFIALRYLRSQHHRGFISFITGIAIIGVALGVASLIITLSVLNGFERTIKENVVTFTAHMQLFAFQNQLLPQPDQTIQEVKLRHPEVMEMAPFLSREGMIRSEATMDGVFIKGIDPSNDVSAAKTRLVEGEYRLESREKEIEGIIIGRRLAQKLEVRPGGRIMLLSLGGSSVSLSQTRVMQFEVRGMYETGMGEFDESYVYIHIKNAQRLFGVGSLVSGFDILLSDVTNAGVLAAEIPEELGYPYFARTTDQMNRNLYTWIELQKKPIPIIIGLIIIVATVNIIGTLLMMVMEKAKEIGILQAMGSGKKQLMNVFLLQGMVIGMAGTILGNILAYGLCWIELRYKFFSLPSGIYYMTHVPIDLSVEVFLLVSLLALLMCFLSALIPSRVAAQQDPIRLIRFV
ncbi:MAG: ABC transporter permease [Ignavibacteriales bacterium]|nr:ABC transporter permease [Ignavibacteriales bacterium]